MFFGRMLQCGSYELCLPVGVPVNICLRSAVHSLPLCKKCQGSNMFLTAMHLCTWSQSIPNFGEIIISTLITTITVIVFSSYQNDHMEFPRVMLICIKTWENNIVMISCILFGTSTVNMHTLDLDGVYIRLSLGCHPDI